MELCRGDGGGGALRGLICGAMPDHGLAGVSMRGGSDGYTANAITPESDLPEQQNEPPKISRVDRAWT